MTSLPLVQLHHVFGFFCKVRNCVEFYDEQTVIYVAGKVIVFHNADHNVQKFIVCNELNDITTLKISSNRKYLAVGDKGVDKPSVLIFDLEALRKKKILSSSDMQSNIFVSVAFSPESKYVIGQGGMPEWTLSMWHWEKNRLITTFKPVNLSPHAEIHEVSFHPQDSSQICIVGKGVFRLYRFTEGAFKQFACQKYEQQNVFLCHSWTHSDKVVVGTQDGRIVVFEAGEIKGEIFVNDTDVGDTQSSHASLKSVMNKPLSTTQPVSCIVTKAKGLICTFGAEKVVVYERIENTEVGYRYVRSVKLPAEEEITDEMCQKARILCLCVSPAEETLVASTDTNQLYSYSLSAAEIQKTCQSTFDFLSHSNHFGSILGLDICIRKPLIATCSTDNSIHIWNFEKRSLDIHKTFQEKVYCVALHPSGLFLVAGFKDKLRVLTVLIDDLRVEKEFPIRSSKECSFSNGGHIFAAVHGNVIQLFSSITYENFANFKGHNGLIRTLVWSTNDHQLVSCGMDGAVYEWDVLSGTRSGESVLKTCSYTGVSTSSDGKTTFAVGTDRTIKEISDSQIIREAEMGNVVLTTVALSHSGRMLFGGTNNGLLRAFYFPLTVPADWQDYTAHRHQIIRMKVTYNDQYVVTSGEDSLLCVWKLADKEGRTMKRDRKTAYSQEILITRADLEEKVNTTSNMH
ncbi:cilia- and flagella-associated protein 57-like [Tachypleus tridentatus]|uniref:cilia- and flagella-associated protein 57-like n=1 Tax=Tachypleus tridentatus TaxID=6853 RepID=UPI003FD3C6EB